MTSLRFRIVASGTLALLLTALFVAGCTMTAPVITRTQPANQATDVPISPATISISFDKPMVEQSADKIVTINPMVSVQKPDTSWINGGRTLVITYPGCFKPNTTYTVTVSADAKATNNVTMTRSACFSFTTAAAAGTTETAPAPTPAPTTQPAQPAQPGQPAQPAQPAQPTLTFSKNIQPLAAARCDGCHGGMATGRMSVYATARKYVTPNQPTQSPYLIRPSGNNHANVWGDQAATVRDWINQGAKE